MPYQLHRSGRDGDRPVCWQLDERHRGDGQRQPERGRRARTRRLLCASVPDWRRYAYTDTYGFSNADRHGYRYCYSYSNSNSYSYSQADAHPAS